MPLIVPFQVFKNELTKKKLEKNRIIRIKKK